MARAARDVLGGEVNYGSTFSGIGGLDLAVEHVFGARCAWQCESNAFCRGVLARHWPGGVHQFADVRDIDRGTAGFPLAPVDIVCGGFPCQDVSVAGKRVGLEAGERTGLWRELARVIGELQPAIVVLENVTGLLGRGFDRVLCDLAALGFDAEWTCLRASDIGAPHRRERLFVLAYTDGGRVRIVAERDQQHATKRRHPKLVDTSPELGDADHDRRSERSEGDDHDWGHAQRGVANRPDAQMADANSVGREGHDDGTSRPGTRGDAAWRSGLGHQWPPRPGDDDGWSCWPGAQPGIRRVIDGATGRVDRRWSALRGARLRALGNAVVHQQAEEALIQLIARLT